MKKIIRNSAKKITSLVLLGIFGFLFLHSELGFLNYDNCNHSTHDYCQIVKNTDAHSKTLRNNLLEPELNKNICIHCIGDVKDDEVISALTITNEHRIFKQSTEVYLFNRTFLI